MKVSKKIIVITSIVTLLPMAAGILLWQQLPETVAIHFGADNVENGWGSKAFAVFGIPIFCLILHWLCLIGTANDPRRVNINQKIFGIIIWICPFCSLLCGGSIYVYALQGGFNFHIGISAQLFVGLLVLVLGNYLPKCRRNYTVGIKLPWTLQNEDNWNSTHRMAGRVWIVCGILLVVLSFLKLEIEWVPIGIIAVMVLTPVAYSFLYYKKHGN